MQAQQTACPSAGSGQVRTGGGGQEVFTGGFGTNCPEGKPEAASRCVTELSEREQQDGIKQDSGVGSVSTYGNEHTEY